VLSRFRSLVLRLIGSPELRPVDAACVWAVGQLLLTGSLALLLYDALARPEVFFMDRDWLELAFELQTRVIVPAWIVFLLVGLSVRRRWPESRILSHPAMQLAVLGGVWGAFLTGLYTFPFGLSALFGLTTGGILLFEVPVVRAGLVSFVAGAVATTLAEQLGLVPYAPLYVGPPVEAGQLDTRFLLPAGVFIVAISLATAWIFMEATQRLRRATALIRRYVPAQLAEKILTGEHAGAAHPERRKVTLFFSDVVGFTEAADQMEPEDLSALLNEYLSEMAKIADDFGATVNQFVGDGIMAFFGAPEATDDRDHALRAVRMALAMQRRMGDLREKWFREGVQTPFRIRIGINTGVASVGDFGSEGRTTYSAIGNQTNLTARIQEHCEPGRVLIGHTTWGLVKDAIPCEERGEIEIKGIHYPVRVYRVVGEAPRP
jgi:adenylate cyclase